MADSNLSAKEYFKARQREWRASGKCNDCSKPPRPGKVRCQDCQDKVNQAGNRLRARRKSEKNNPGEGDDLTGV